MHNAGMATMRADFKKIGRTRAGQKALLVSDSYHKAAQDKEEVDGQESLWNEVVRQGVIDENSERGKATQSVQCFEMSGVARQKHQ